MLATIPTCPRCFFNWERLMAAVACGYTLQKTNDWNPLGSTTGIWSARSIQWMDHGFSPMENPKIEKSYLISGFPKLPADDWPLSMGESKFSDITWDDKPNDLGWIWPCLYAPHPSPHRLNPPGETLMLLVNPNRTVGHGQPQTWIGGWWYAYPSEKY